MNNIVNTQGVRIENLATAEQLLTNSRFLEIGGYTWIVSLVYLRNENKPYYKTIGLQGYNKNTNVGEERRDVTHEHTIVKPKTLTNVISQM